MLADEAEHVEIGFRGLLGELFEHFGFGFGAEDQTDFFVPSGVDLVEFARAGMDKFFEVAALLLHARDGNLTAFERIEDAEKVLAFAKHDLRGAADSAVIFVFVLHEIRTSHGSMLPTASGPFPEGNELSGTLL